MLTICAEIGINHNGSEHWCHELIRQAADAGADLCKFQLYDPEILYAHQPDKIPIRNQCRIPRRLFDKILRWAEQEQIEPCFSVFHEDRLEWCREAGVRTLKLASRTLADDQPLCRAVAATDAVVYASLGRVSVTEADGIFAQRPVRYLHCVPRYPAEYQDYTASTAEYGPDNYYGISDHTLGIGVSLVAIGHGARFAEKHFTLDKTLPGPDHACSIDRGELAALVRYGHMESKVLIT